MARQKTIVVATGKPQRLNEWSEHFRTDGWKVVSLGNSSDALVRLTKRWAHAAIIDLQLDDPNNPQDASGLDLIKATDPIIPKIAWTAFPDFRIAKETLSTGENGIPLAVDLIDASKSTETLLDTTNKVVKKKAKINFSLKVNPEPRHFFGQLLRRTDGYDRLSDGEIEALSEELEDLVRGLFCEAEQLDLTDLMRVAWGSSVFKGRWETCRMKSRQMVVKFGERADMIREVSNYTEYVQPFVGQYAATLLGMRETLNLGAAVFSYIEGPGREPYPFSDFYHQASDQQVRNALCCLFEINCARWYGGKLDWLSAKLDQEPEKFAVDGLRNCSDPLARALERQKGFDKQEKLNELRATVELVLNGETLCQSRFERISQSQFGVVFSDPGSKTLSLTDPVHYITTHRCDFPPPTCWAITHGDLHGGNVLLDKENHLWLIDFLKTGWGPALRDFAQMEAAMRIELCITDNLLALSELEDACLKPRVFNDRITFIDTYNIRPDKLIDSIHCVRELASRLVVSDMHEYYITLLYHTLKLIVWKGSLVQEREFDVRQRHALISAGLICNKLVDWPKPPAGDTRASEAGEERNECLAPSIPEAVAEAETGGSETL